MIAQQVASKAVRDGLFLGEFDVTALPFATLAAAATSFGAALFVGRLLATRSPARIVPLLFAANGTLFALEALALSAQPRVVAAGVYLHIAAFGGAVVSGFWSVMNERFDPYTAKRVMGRIAAGSTFGGVLGGALTWALTGLPTHVLLGAFTVGSLLCAAGMVALRGGAPAGAESERSEREPKRSGVWSGVEVLATSRYPRLLAGLVFVGALMTGLIDYVFKASVAENTPPGELVGFFAAFYTVVGVATFVVQALASKPVLERGGVVSAVALFPLLAGGLLATALLAPSMLVFVALRGGAMVIENSLYRSGYELLYTAVPSSEKRRAKILIDLAIDRLGTAAASGAVLVVLALTSTHLFGVLATLGLCAALAGLGVLVAVRREYVASLAARLRDNATGAQASVDATRTLASTFVGDLDNWLESAGAGRSESSASSPRATMAALREAAVARAAQKRARRVPASAASAPSARGPAFAPAVDLLDTPLRRMLRAELAPEARQLLRRVAPASVGQLADLFLTHREADVVQVRAASLLADVPTERSAQALVAGLRAPEMRVRRAAALALLCVVSAAPSLRPRRRAVSEWVARELERPTAVLPRDTPLEQASPFRSDAQGHELAPIAEIAFLLLALSVDVESLQLALHGITSGDAMQRGTALELLDNVLPADVRARLLALLERAGLTHAGARTSDELRARLAHALRRGDVDVVGVRRRYREERRV